MAVRVLSLLALLLLAGCGGEEKASTHSSGSTNPTQTLPSTRNHPEVFGYIRSVSTAGPTATLAFDQAEFLTGDEAQNAAEDEGVVPPGEPVPNDYYVSNPDKGTRVYPIATTAAITAHRCPPCRHGKPGSLEDFLASFMEKGQTYADPYRGAESQYWLTIEDGEVVAIDEQYVP